MHGNLFSYSNEQYIITGMFLRPAGCEEVLTASMEHCVLCRCEVQIEQL